MEFYSYTTKTENEKCLITNIKKEQCYNRKGKPQYKLLIDYYYDYFETVLYPEYFDNKRNRILQFKYKCFINEIIIHGGNLDLVNKEYVEKYHFEYNNLHVNYFTRKNGGDIKKGTQAFNDRQSTTSKQSFIKRYGKEEGEEKFKKHFKHIHDSTSGDKHWTRNLDTTMKEHIMKLHNITEKEANNYFNHYNAWKCDGMTDREIYERRRDTGIYAQTFYTPEMREHWHKKMTIVIEQMKQSGDYHKKFGCWKACYNYAIDNNLDYTDETRIDIWHILFNGSDVRHWLRKGFSQIESQQRIKQNKRSSKQSDDALMEIEDKLNVTITFEKRIDRYFCDGVIENSKIAIEYNGDYWHMNPTQYKENDIHKTTKLLAKDVWKHDENKRNIISEHGYIPFIIWEYDWNNNKEEIINQLKQLI